MTDVTTPIRPEAASLPNVVEPEAAFKKLLDTIGIPKESDTPYAEEATQIRARDSLAKEADKAAVAADRTFEDSKALMEASKLAAKSERKAAEQHRLEAGRVLVSMRANLGSKAKVYAWAAEHCGISQGTAKNWYLMADDPKAFRARQENHRAKTAERRAKKAATAAGSTEPRDTRKAPVKSARKVSKRMSLIAECEELYSVFLCDLKVKQLEDQLEHLQAQLEKREAA